MNKTVGVLYEFPCGVWGVYGDPRTYSPCFNNQDFGSINEADLPFGPVSRLPDAFYRIR